MSVEYREVERFKGYRFGSDGSVWTKWGRSSRGVGGGKGRLAVIASEWKKMKPLPGKRYFKICLRGTWRDIHKLILEAFVGPCPLGMEACHNNGISTDNRIENLRWDTRLNNARDRIRHGTVNSGERNGQAKLTRDEVTDIRASNMTRAHLARMYGVCAGNIYMIKSGRTWRVSR